MSRIARVVIPGHPHHVTQRGVRRMDVFFSDDDRRAYLDLLSKHAASCGITFLAWCLMPNHIHLVAVPEEATSLARGIGEAHRRYTRRVNFRNGWRGYLFQGRFYSCPLEGRHTMAAVRYVLRNPVRAGLTPHPWEYRWSSARWMVGESPEDRLAKPSPMLEDVSDWRAFLSVPGQDLGDFRRHTRTGRPLGSSAFVDHVEATLGRRVRPQRRGRKRN